MSERNYKFSFGVSNIQATTDFFLEYNASGSPARLSVGLRQVWERIVSSDPTNPYTQRRAVEERIRILNEAVGRQGVLKIDNLQVGVKTFNKITLESFSPLQIDNNLMIEYELRFAFPDGPQLARSWAAEALDATAPEPEGTDMGSDTDFMLVTRTTDDRTSFKEVFRNAPVRIYNGPSMTLIRLSGIRQLLTPALSDLVRRQEAESIIANMLPNVGKKFDLTIDGTITEDSVHCSAISPVQLNLPDAVTYELEFRKGWVE